MLCFTSTALDKCQAALADRHQSSGVALVVVSAGLLVMLSGEGSAATKTVAQDKTPPASGAPKAAPAAPVKLDIDEYVVEGVDILPQAEVEAAVYPFLGPNRTSEDVEKARAALEKVYRDKGYQAVIVEIPAQNATNGVVKLKAIEAKVGRLAVNGSKYFSPEKIKKSAPSMAEGKPLDFNEVQKDIVALNQWPDRKVTPALRAGAAPGTVDVDLNVEDKFPFHASTEINNRQSSGTTPYRLSSNVRYENLWQAGHSASFSYSVAPNRPKDSEVFSGSYLFRVPNYNFLSIQVSATKSSSDVNTVGNLNIVGPGTIVGVRALYTLPAQGNLFHTISAGFDYKNFDELIRFRSQDASRTPIEYFPASVNYNAFVQHEGGRTEINTAVTFAARELGSSPAQFDAKRYKAFGDFFYFRGDVAHTEELPQGFQLYGKVRGQIANQPLVSSEEFSAGGLDTVRGYFESAVLGDNALGGTIELRSPNLPVWFGQLAGAPAKGSSTKDGATEPDFFQKAAKTFAANVNELRVYAFADRAYVTISDPLPDQTSRFDLASYGVGTRFKILDYLNGSVDYAVPLFKQGKTKAGDDRVTFRVSGEF